MFMKEEGIKLELEKEIMFNLLQAHASLNRGSEVEEVKKEVIKTIYPDMKNKDEELMEQAKQTLDKYGDKLRVTLDTKKKLDPYEANALLNNQ